MRFAQPIAKSSTAILWATLLAVGCDNAAPTGDSAPPQPAPPAVAIEPPAAPPAAQPAAPPAANPQAAAQPQAAAPVEPAAEEMERKKAQAGVGVQGQDIPQELGTTAVKAYFMTKQRTVFDIQIPSALNLYKAERGYGPKSHDDFMEQIVRANQIQLPELPPGQRYLWDPEKQELFVEHPKRK